MDREKRKQHLLMDVQFHLRCARVSAVKVMDMLDIKNVDDHQDIEMTGRTIMHIDEVLT